MKREKGKGKNKREKGKARHESILLDEAIKIYLIEKMQLLLVFYIIGYLLALGCVVVMVTDQIKIMSMQFYNRNESIYVNYYLKTLCWKEACINYKSGSTFDVFATDSITALFPAAISSLIIWVMVIPVYLLREKYSKMGYIIIAILSLSEIFLMAVIGIEWNFKKEVMDYFSHQNFIVDVAIGPSMIIAIIGIILMIGTSVLFYLGEVRGMGN